MPLIPTPQEIKEAIDELFEKAETVPSLMLWRALYPADTRHAPAGKVYEATFAYRETQELQKLLMLIDSILEKGTESEEAEVRIKLMGYCQIMERDLPLALIWNLLRVIGNDEAQWVFHENKQDCIYASQKMNAIKARSENLHLRIGEVLSSIWDSDIRNAFAHGYYILGHGYILLNGSLSPISSGGKYAQTKRAENPSYQELRDRYEAARNFFFTLAKAHPDFYQRMRAKHRPANDASGGDHS